MLERKAALMRRCISLPILTAIGLVTVTNRPSVAQPAPQAAYVPTENQRIRRAINLENWDDGGESTHYAYLHMSEVFPTASIHRNGPISPLVDAPNPAVGAYVVKTENGRKISLAEYVAGDNGIDGIIV